MQTLSPADKDFWKHIVAAGNQLGLQLLPSFMGPGSAGNVVFSPTSVFVLLCLVYNGACGNTYIELATALGLPADKDLNPWMRQLINYINSHDPQTLDVQMASALFFASGEHLHFDFANTLTESYSASLYSIDFFEPDAVDRVNAWVSNATKKKIERIAPEFDPSMRFVLLNAIYFLGRWADPFSPSQTTMRDFYVMEGGVKKVAMMSHQGPSYYYEDNDCQSVLLPYQGGNYAMQIVLPKTMQSPIALLPRIQEIAARAANSVKSDVALALPKFEFDFHLQLQNTLAGLGISDLSDPVRCDLGRIGHNIVVSRIIHQAVIKVDEQGTEAAAVTAAMGLGLPQAASQSIEMTVDHPFLFSICDTVTGQILFLGTIFVP